MPIIPEKNPPELNKNEKSPPASPAPPKGPSDVSRTALMKLIAGRDFYLIILRGKEVGRG